MAKYAEALEHNAAMKRSGGKKELRGISIEKAENGGHIVEHRFNSGDGPYHEPEQHVFGTGDGKKLLAHVAKHMNIKVSEEHGAESQEPEED
jgi:hypothetical protein